MYANKSTRTTERKEKLWAGQVCVCVCVCVGGGGGGGIRFDLPTLNLLVINFSFHFFSCPFCHERFFFTSELSHNIPWLMVTETPSHSKDVHET